jgi:hypothetical protein
MADLRRLSMDSSEVNALTFRDDGAAVLAGIQEGYFTRIAFPSVTEPLATSDEVKRNRLFKTLNALRKNGECLEAHHWIFTQLVKNFEKDRSSKWDSLDIRFVECEQALARGELSEKESKEEREFAADSEARFTATFGDARPHFEEVFTAGTVRPATADELRQHLDGVGGAFWNYASGLYQRAAGHRPTEDQVRAFVDDCPPFLALMLSLMHAQFEWSIREKQITKRKRVGKIDLFCAGYLPYCDIFITNDAEQRRCLREIAAAAKLSVEVYSHAQFRDRLMVGSFLKSA